MSDFSASLSAIAFKDRSIPLSSRATFFIYPFASFKSYRESILVTTFSSFVCRSLMMIPLSLSWLRSSLSATSPAPNTGFSHWASLSSMSSLKPESSSLLYSLSLNLIPISRKNCSFIDSRLPIISFGSGEGLGESPSLATFFLVCFFTDRPFSNPRIFSTPPHLS